MTLKELCWGIPRGVMEPGQIYFSRLQQCFSLLQLCFSLLQLNFSLRSSYM